MVSKTEPGLGDGLLGPGKLRPPIHMSCPVCRGRAPSDRGDDVNDGEDALTPECNEAMGGHWATEVMGGHWATILLLRLLLRRYNVDAADVFEK